MRRGQRRGVGTDASAALPARTIQTVLRVLALDDVAAVPALVRLVFVMVLVMGRTAMLAVMLAVMGLDLAAMLGADSPAFPVGLGLHFRVSTGLHDAAALGVVLAMVPVVNLAASLAGVVHVSSVLVFVRLAAHGVAPL